MKKIQIKILIRILVISLSLVMVNALAANYGVAGQQGAKSTPYSSSFKQLLAGQSAGAANDKALAPLAAQTVKASKLTGSATTHANANQNAQPNSVSSQAFATVVRNMMPLTPTQIRTLRYLFNQSQKAAAAYPGTPPRPTSSSVMINLSPGATPPIIRLRAGFVTSLVFLDSTGKPWPIQAYDLGDPKSFNIQWNQKGNTLLVQAQNTYKSGNLAVMLKGKDTPVMITLMPGQRAVDYRVDLRVPGFGPNASPITSSLPMTSNPQLINFLDGVAPQGSKTLQVSGGLSQAWLYGKHVYVRTRLTLLSPSWLSQMSSPDGTNVYEITKTPVLLVSNRGKIQQLIIQGL